MGVREAFNRDARDYDSSRRRLVTCFDAFYGAALAAIPHPAQAELSVADLGAGTGLLARLVADARPRARVLLVDVAGEMLEQAKRRCADPGRFRFVCGDYAKLALGRRDAIVSALSINHLENDAKRALFARIHAALRPGGVFVNADQVAGETADEDARNRARWASEARGLGASEAELAAARERMREDRPGTLSAQLRWLREAGFPDPACVFAHGMFAVFAARKAAG